MRAVSCGHMAIIVFQHAESEHPGRLGDELRRLGVRLDIRRLDLPAGPGSQGNKHVPPDFDEVEGVISLGGPMMVSDHLPWMQPEMDFLAEAHRRQVPLVGFTLTAAMEDTWSAWLRAAIGGLALALVYALLAAFFPRGMGWGDAKLALSLGSVMAWVGWGTLVVGGFGAFVLGAVWGVGAIVVGMAGRKSALPFGPFMIASALLAVVWGQRIADWYTDSLI